jgi:histone-lysine N-methyltransferase SETD2
VNSSSCLCRQQERECEPGQCVKCWSDKAGAKCDNNFVQRRNPRKTEVRRAQHGWGLFALEDIRSGDFIIDYAGEIYSSDTAEPRGIVANHIKRNYNFGLSSRTDVDAYAAGNESRVINDYITKGKSNWKKINCLVKSACQGAVAYRQLTIL